MNTKGSSGMRYQTSFYMHIRNYVKLAKASQRTGITMHDLIVQILHQYAMNHKKMQVAKGTVQYQNVDKRTSWRIFRIALDEKNYELFTDMRKVMKKMVNFILKIFSSFPPLCTRHPCRGMILYSR